MGQQPGYESIDVGAAGASTEVDLERVSFWATYDARFKDRRRDWQPALLPRGAYQEWLAEQIAHISLRLRQLPILEEAWKLRQARRAGPCWDVDRRADVAQLALGMEKRPARVRAKLEQSLHG